jgi:hypothetical protein
MQPVEERIMPSHLSGAADVPAAAGVLASAERHSSQVEQDMARRPDGVTMIAVWYFILAGCCVLGLAGMGVGLLGIWSGGDFHGALLSTFGMMIGVMAIAGTGAAFGVVGWGLLQLKDWSRGAAKMMAVIQLILVPFGTVAGIIILVYLSRNENAKLAFEA